MKINSHSSNPCQFEPQLYIVAFYNISPKFQSYLIKQTLFSPVSKGLGIFNSTQNCSKFQSLVRRLSVIIVLDVVVLLQIDSSLIQ